MAKKPRDDNNEIRDVAGEENSAIGSAYDAADEERRRVESESYASGVINGPTPLNDATTEAKKSKKTLEKKRADFSRLASARVSRAIDALNALNHLSSVQSYDWTEEAKDKIFAALREKIDTVEASFVEAKVPTEGRKKTSKQLSFRV
jgi:hypothetical protein